VELLHLVLHFLLKESAVQLLDHERVAKVDLVLVFVFVRSGFSDFRLTLYPVHSLLQSILFVFDTLFKRNNSFLPFFLLVIDVFHKVVQSVPGLKLVLLGTHLLLGLFLVNLLFAP